MTTIFCPSPQKKDTPQKSNIDTKHCPCFNPDPLPKNLSKAHHFGVYIGCDPPPRIPVGNEGLGWDPILKMLHVNLVVTGILGGGNTQGSNLPGRWVPTSVPIQRPH